MRDQIREIRVIDLITYALLPVVIIPLVWVFGTLLVENHLTQISWLFYTIFGIISYFLLRRFIIGVVLVYKAFAPIDVRRQCRFTPTCSTYMIMAVKKYGIIIGIIKGIRRILRCKPPNGGVDYP